MSTGKINVTADNIFPIIKKFLYSDHEIFLRELISNAVDATTKLKQLSRMGEAQGELGDLTIQIEIDEENKQLRIIDKGVGMTAEEVDQYINQLAFSGAEDFLKKYEGKLDGADIIGHFGLGFYSAFMVSSKVEIITRSYKAEANEAVHWTCEGNPEFTLDTVEKAERGTEIILNIAEDSEEFLKESRIGELLDKYAKFMQVPVQFGTREETVKEGEGDDAVETKVTVPHIVNNTEPAWTKSPADLKDEDYAQFYRELYPMSFEQPLFHIHLNVDYPFDLTGVLFFPSIKPNMEIQKNKIQLYQSQVFVTDHVEGIVPDFLTLLHGVIDSKDIPLNVSRSYLQNDHNVRKISSHITKKVADKLEELFKADREDFAQKWNDIKVIIEYGMLSEEKFFDRAKKFALMVNTKEEKFTIDEYIEKVGENQVNKNGETVILYTANPEAQHGFIAKAQAKGYDVVVLDSPLTSHYIQKLESSYEKLKFARVDADTIDKLIEKEENNVSVLSEKQLEDLKSAMEENVNKAKFNVRLENMDSSELPLTITVPEFMRRMKEMQATGGGGMFMGDLPETYELIVNTNHPLASRILDTEGDERGTLIRNATDLAMLQQNLLHGEALTNFIQRSVDNL
ncbi:molecular chaperone HtpG [Phaeocystidibacter marisrubri]|uniref:Chaperone protein HtpG n=1 Tax=Phaeocystidibacter marisrubri TaxID=1577780 RepID=A0A6L3ZLM3_9FLAO|nr:molecular chaperone HtpG [Phaeocystidibacter marisrubri]KAB2818050.1 molecular chaperone HtpG [Phaeocystidibacter marisrubri]GGH72204.1 chaperone protein HtpG [Phaeocystidibacter marisrubri]